MTERKDEDEPVANAVKRRYGGENVARGAAAWNDTLSIQMRHRSVRRFLPRKLNDGTLELIIAAAQSASTSSNLQSWTVIVIEDQMRKDRLAALSGSQKHVSQAPVVLAWVADLSRLSRIASARRRKLDGTDYLEAAITAIIDATLGAQNAMIAAESLGLSGVFVGGLRNHPTDLAKELRLPPLAFAVFGLCLGYEDMSLRSEVKPRLPQGVVFHRETYGSYDEAARIAAYDTYAKIFREEQGMTGSSWTEQSINRMVDADALGNRQNLRQELAELGFRLK